MRLKNRKVICTILVILIIFSGMCFDSFKTDSLFVYTPNTETLSAAVTDVQAYTTKILCIPGYTRLQQCANRFSNIKREAKLSLCFLCSNILSPVEGKFYTSSETFHFIKQCQGRLVLNYIHKSDGKKKI